MSLQLRPGRLIHHLMEFSSKFAPDLKPRLQVAVFRAAYSFLSRRMGKEDISFLNYGYAPQDGGPTLLELDPSDEPHRLSIQLYARVAGARDLRGKDVLEIGCGRGGGASFIARYLQPASLVGLDLSDRAIEFCSQRHQIPGLSFRRGEADNLPLGDHSADAVVNVESSHCYPSFERFLDEVVRVLRPNGLFLFTDFRTQQEWPTVRQQLKKRFIIHEEEYINKEVVRALHLDSDRRNRIIQKTTPRLITEGAKGFAAVEGTPMFDALASGTLPYMRFVLEKIAV